MNLAREHGLGYIVTGLARGQLFETRLSDLYNHRIFDVEQIDEYVLEARKAYHHIDDAVSRHLDVSAFADDRIFDEIQFVDFYRYTDVSLDHVLTFLARQTPWVLPSDTGRSTNCLINDVGIHVHRRERGFHNYALPYSWDVRLGHKQREAALDELDDDIDEEFVHEVLVEIGYKPKPAPRERQTARLVAHYQAASARPDDEIQAVLADSLPAHMIPTAFVHHELLPLTRNGKIDRAALPVPGDPDRGSRAGISLDDVEDRRAAEAMLAVWSEIFDREIGLGDNFFDLGGDSITAIQIVDRAGSAGLEITPRQLFAVQTVAAAAAVATETEIERPTMPGYSTAGSDDGSYPLTPTQSGMLFHTLAEPGSGIYEGQIVHHLRGEIDHGLLERCWQELIDRHDTLRAIFRWEGLERAEQRAVEVAAATIVHHDWSTESADGGADERLADFLSRDRANGFDLAIGPPVRLALVRLPGGAALVWSFHHIALDGWSIALAINELLDSYQASVDGRPWLPPSRRPFARYLDWLDGQSRAQAEVFWREELSGFAAPTALPRSTSTDRATAVSERQPYRRYGASQRRLDERRTKALLGFTGEQRVTLSTALQAAWGLVLARYEGSDDVVFGVTTSGRPATLPGAETMIGMLVTTLPARIRIEGAQRPGDWLRAIQDRQLGVRDHEYAALVDVQRWSDVPSGQGLFNSILVVENFPDYEPPAAGGADGSVLAIESRDYRVQSNYPLSLIVLPGPELTLKVVCDPDEFSEARVEEILGHVDAMLDSLASGAAATVDELAMIDSTEIDRLDEWSSGPALDHEPTLLPDLIRQHAEQRPDAVAVVCGDRRLSYGELYGAATEVAGALRAAGVGPDVFVGVLLERSIEMVVAIAGVLEAGGAYLPLDPSSPDERLRFMVADAGAVLLRCDCRGLSESRRRSLTDEAGPAEPVAATGPT
ncbi:MAG: condensation domain-containing protein, partial [Acidimicrobiales bacterium]